MLIYHHENKVIVPTISQQIIIKRLISLITIKINNNHAMSSFVRYAKTQIFLLNSLKVVKFVKMDLNCTKILLVLKREIVKKITFMMQCSKNVYLCALMVKYYL